MTAYGYCRVSTHLQADHGQSLDVQGRMIEAYSTLHELGAVSLFIDRGVSGSKPLSDRPEGAKLLAALHDGDIVIASRLDRMFRSALDALAMLELFKARGIKLYLIDLGGDVTGDGIAKLVFQILSAVAEAERDRIRERIRDVKADQKKRNRYLGGCAPYGYRIEAGELVPEPEEQKHIVAIRLHRANGLSLRAIAAALAADGITLSHMAVKSALARK